jgi:hypothetical protein
LDAAMERTAGHHFMLSEGQFGTEEDFKMRRNLLALAALAAFTVPASAAEFYIVQDASTKRCTIVEQKPTSTTSVVVGGGVFATRVEAESSMRTTKVCTDNTGTTTTTTTTRQ